MIWILQILDNMRVQILVQSNLILAPSLLVTILCVTLYQFNPLLINTNQRSVRAALWSYFTSLK